jgi:hypothetical protein
MTDKKKNYNFNKDESDNDSVQSDSPIKHLKTRHSKRATSKMNETSPMASATNDLSKQTSTEDTSPSKTNKKTSKKSENKLQIQLKTTIQEVFNHKLKEMDLDFLKLLFTCLPTLDDTWNRIGFNHETKENRLDNYYKKLKVTTKNNKII